MAEHAGFAAAITVRERVFSVALSAGYANGSESSKKFVEDLSGDGIGMAPDLFLGPADIDCEGATNRLVATLPMWGTVTVTQNGGSHVVGVNGEIELAIAPAFTTGPAGSPTASSLVLHPINTVIDARRWTATVTSPVPPDVAALVTGEEFRARFEEVFRLGFFAGRVSLPSIDASFLGPIVRKASSVSARIRDGALMLGLNYSDDTHTLNGDPEQLHNFAVNHDVAGVVHPDAVDILLDELHTEIIDGVEAEDATLDNFSIRARNSHFRVSGTASKSTGSVNFSFRLVPSMFHTRPGAYFRYEFKPVRIRSRTWPALGFHIEDVETDVDRAWWVVVFGEVLLGILTIGLSIFIIEGIAQATEGNFSAKVKAGKSAASCRTHPADQTAARRHRSPNRSRDVRHHRVGRLHRDLGTGPTFALDIARPGGRARHIPERRAPLHPPTAGRDRPRSILRCGSTGRWRIAITVSSCETSTAPPMIDCGSSSHQDRSGRPTSELLLASTANSESPRPTSQRTP